MSKKHTPGPWHEANGGVFHRPDGEAFGKLVARVYAESAAIRRANAALIAAAPELLDSAKRFLAADTPDEHDARANALHDAIAKAEGRS